MTHQGFREDFTVGPEDLGERLDVFLSQRAELSRSQIKAAFSRAQITLNDKVPSKAGIKLSPGDRVSANIPPTLALGLRPQDNPLTILHEDKDLVVLVKPAGMVVHPAPGHPDGTLVNALLHRYRDHLVQLGDQSAPLRPGIVHRLDKDTSGVMVVARTARGVQSLAAQFADHSIQRRYLALVLSKRMGEEGTFSTGHGRHPNDRKRFTGKVDSRRHAVTHYKTLEVHHRGTSLLACTLETGRTHQIRMHLAEVQAPILGDAVYGKARAMSKLIARQALHAELLGFVHPDGHELSFEVPPPEDFQSALQALQAGKSP